MRAKATFALPVVAAFFALLLVPRTTLASIIADCPTEPKSNVPIADGEVYSGSDCNLYTDGDIDSFVFTGMTGETYQLAAAVNGGSDNICMTIYDPSAVRIFSGCTSIGFPSYLYSVVTDLKLTANGTYTVDVTEPSGSSGTQNYAVSLERLYPFPPNAQPVPQLGQAVAGNIAALTDSNAFTFTEATTGTYQVTASLPSDATTNLCMYVYKPDGTSAGSGCTSIGFPSYVYSVMVDYTPSQNGTSMPFLYVAGNDGTATYNLEVSCLVGVCPPQGSPPPSCTLTDSLVYDAASSTLTMNFNVGNNYLTVWNAWLTYQTKIVSLFSTPQPITEPPVAVTKTSTVAPNQGKIGVLSTLVAPKKGITCSSWVQVNTGIGP